MKDALNVIKEKWLSILAILAMLIWAWIPQISNSANVSIYDDILISLGYQWYIFIAYAVLVFLSMRMSITFSIKLLFGSSIKKIFFTILGLLVFSFFLQLFISHRNLLHKFYEIICNPDPFIRSIITTYCIVYDSINEFINLLKKRKEQ